MNNVTLAFIYVVVLVIAVLTSQIFVQVLIRMPTEPVHVIVVTPTPAATAEAPR